MSGAEPVHPDRVGLQAWLQWSLVSSAAVGAAVAGQMVVAHRSGTPLLGELGGAAVAVLSLVGLRSLSLRLLARVVLAVSGVVVLRFGEVGSSLAVGGQGLMIWVVAAVITLVLADRVGTDIRPGLSDPAPIDLGRPSGGGTARAVVAVVAVVLALAVVGLPLALERFQPSADPGDPPTLDGRDGAGTSLRSTDRLDMTQRPALTDEVVFTVNSDRRTFWRGETFDVWDGRTWTRSDLSLGLLPGDGTVTASSDDLGSTGADLVTQRFRIEVDRADVIYAAASAVQVEATQRLGQRRDGTVVVAERFMGPGTTYTVRSRRIPAGEDQLRTAEGPIPADIAARYASEPMATERVLRAATQATAGATTTYDKVRAIERWMGERTEYSLDAPLSPQGVDVVDHFLFESRLGWCEQIASSLVVLARANEIPARLVTGFVPGERDPVSGVYVVRGRDAHAWAEVWFPEVGWVAFDPTADVPLAGEDQAEPTPAEWILDHLLVIVLGLATLAVAGWAAWRLARRMRDRVSARPVGWAAVADRDLEELGGRVGRARLASETASTYAADLADRYGEPALAQVGRAVDDSLFAPDGATGPAMDGARDLLDRLLAEEPPSKELVGVSGPAPGATAGEGPVRGPG